MLAVVAALRMQRSDAVKALKAVQQFLDAGVDI